MDLQKCGLLLRLCPDLYHSSLKLYHVHVIGFTSMESTTGRALTEALMSQVATLGLQPENMVAQAYDGASNMSGAFNGVQALIRERCQHAVYIHCFSHTLNLVLSRASTIPEIRSAITGIQDACNFFKNSSLRTEQFKNAIEKICPKSNHSRLKQHCATRWVERHDSIFIFLELYKPLVSLLNTNQERSLANLITEPSFLVSVHVLQEVLGLTKNLSTTLQSKKMNFISAVAEIDEVIDTLQSWRQDDCDSTFDAAFSAADKLYSEIESDDNADITIPRLAGRQRNRANVPADTPRQYYKRCIWYPYVDSVLTELRERFNKHSKTAFSLALILPANCIDATFGSFEHCVQMYASLLPDGMAAIRMEYGRWQRKWVKTIADERPLTISDTLRCCEPSMYPNISVLRKIFSTIPVTTATAERSFSQLGLLKTYLRTTMAEDRLNGLALMAIHKDMSIRYDHVIDQYARDHNPRLKFT